MRFFNPASELKELLLLQHIKKNPHTTQKKIAQVISSSVSMVNTYIDQLEENGYMKREYKSAKTVYYNITQEGGKRKGFLLISYMKELVELYILAKENVEKFLVEVEDAGHNNLLIYGAGEVAETILSVVKARDDNNIKISAIVDDDKSIQNDVVLEHIIICKEDIHKYKHDAIIITSYTYEDEIREKLNEINYPANRILSFFV